MNAFCVRNVPPTGAVVISFFRELSSPDSKEMKAITAGKQQDKTVDFHSTKVRVTVRCCSCATIRVI